MVAERKPTSTIVWGIALGLVSLLTVVNGLEQAFHFGGSPMDGPLQLFNALRRIDAGQRPGVDFQVFHGVGLAYLHYVPYRLLGGGFLAGEVTRQLTTALLYPLSLLLFLRVFTGNWKKTFLLSTAVMSVSLALRLTTVVVAINSLLGARSFFALMVPAVWYANRARGHWRTILGGATAGAALLTGTEQGISIILASVIVLLIGAARRHRWIGVAIDIGIFVGTSIATTVVFLLAVGGWRGALSILHYNFGSLPRDQYWYFGVAPSEYAATWGAFFSHLISTPTIPFVVIVAIGFVVLHLRRADQSGGDEYARSAALSVVALYGVISCASILGIFLVGYAGPCARIVLLLAAIEVADRPFWSDVHSRITKPALIGLASIVLMVASVPSLVTSGLVGIPHILEEHVFSRQPIELIRIWPPSIAVTDSVLRSTPVETGHARLWSTYSGLAEARAGIFNPSFDYIIHALGPENRRAYAETFRSSKPTLVQTLLPTYSPYEAWLTQTSGEFYLDLLRNYRAAAATPWSIYWRRTDSVAAASLPIAAVKGDGSDSIVVRLPGQPHANSVILLDLTIEYEAGNPLHALPLVGPLPRYLVSIDGAVSAWPATLDPYVTTARFPVIAYQGRNLVLRFRTESLLPGASIAVGRVAVSALPITPNNIPWVENSIAAAQRWNPKK